MDTVLRVRTSLLATAGRLSWLPPTLARLAVGVVFAGTGWGKLHHLDKITSFFADLGIPAPGFNAVLVGSAELICGVLLLIGLFTRLASLPLIVVMAVAIPHAIPFIAFIPAMHFCPAFPFTITETHASTPLHGFMSGQLSGIFRHENLQFASQPVPAHN